MISIHAPRAGRDPSDHGRHEPRHISIHAPRAGRDSAFRPRLPYNNISIHAPRAGRDQEGKQAYGSNEQFQSTRPVRGATGAVGGHGVVQMISIHAPRAGRDTIAAISAMHSS